MEKYKEQEFGPNDVKTAILKTGLDEKVGQCNMLVTILGRVFMSEDTACIEALFEAVIERLGSFLSSRDIDSFVILCNLLDRAMSLVLPRGYFPESLPEDRELKGKLLSLVQLGMKIDFDSNCNNVFVLGIGSRQKAEN